MPRSDSEISNLSTGSMLDDSGTDKAESDVEQFPIPTTATAAPPRKSQSGALRARRRRAPAPNGVATPLQTSTPLSGCAVQQHAVQTQPQSQPPPQPPRQPGPAEQQAAAEPPAAETQLPDANGVAGQGNGAQEDHDAGQPLLRRALESLFSPLYTFFTAPQDKEQEQAPDVDLAHEQVREDAVQAQLQEIPVDTTGEESPARRQPVNSPRSVEAEEFDPYTFIASLPPLSSLSERPATCLASKSPKAPAVTLVLDLDETLVHCSTEPLRKADLEFNVLFNDYEYKVFARKRPHMEKFLTEVSALFEIVVFTASHRLYAERLLTLLDPENRWFQQRCYRESCVFLAGNYLKDLTVLGRDLSRTAIIDNSPQAFAFHLNNGIPIETWTDSDDDQELLKLLPLLKELATLDDVRPRIHTEFDSQRKVNDKRKQLERELGMQL